MYFVNKMINAEENFGYIFVKHKHVLYIYRIIYLHMLISPAHFRV